MEYNECKQALYNSELIGNIPDSWKGEVPIIFEEYGEKKIGFLFSKVGDGKTKLKKMIVVSIENAKIVEYNARQLKENFQISTQSMKAIQINDYDIYFKQKQKYEEMISNIVNNKAVINKEFIQLTKEFFSTEQYEKIVFRIEKSLIKNYKI